MDNPEIPYDLLTENTEAQSLLSTVESDDTEKEEPKKASASSFSALLNLTNSMMGSGILTQAFALRCSGMALGFIYMIIFMGFSFFSAKIIMKVTQETQQFTYKGLASKFFSPRVCTMIEVIFLLYPFTLCVIYIIVMGDLLPELLQNWTGLDHTTHWYIGRYFSVSILTIFVLLPMSVGIRNMHTLRFSSMFALISITYIVFFVVFTSILSPDSGFEENQFGELYLWRNGVSPLVSLSLVMFAFACQLNVQKIFAEIPIEKRFDSQYQNRIFLGALALAFFAYSGVGYGGYLLFHEQVNKDLLVSFARYQPDNVFNSIASIALLFVMIFSFPIMLFPARASLHHLIISSSHPSKNDTFNWWKFILEGLFVLSVTYIIGVYVTNDITLVFGFFGSTIGVCINLILPACFYLGMVKSKQISWETLPVYMVLIFGCTITFLSLYVYSTGNAD